MTNTYPHVRAVAKTALATLPPQWTATYHELLNHEWEVVLRFRDGHLSITYRTDQQYEAVFFKHPHDYDAGDILFIGLGATPMTALGNLTLQFYNHANEMQRYLSIIESACSSS